MKTTVLSGIMCLLFAIPVGHTQTNSGSAVTVDEATARFIAKDYATALTLFRRLRSNSTDAASRIRLQWNIARCLEELGRHTEALRIFEDYSRSVGDPVRSSRARAKIDRLNQLVFGTVSVSCQGGGAIQVTVQGRDGSSPCPTVIDRLEPGATVIEGRRGKDETVRSIVKVQAGETTEAVLTFALKVAPVAPVAKPASHWPWYVGATAVIAASAITLWAVNRDDPPTRHQVRLCIEAQCDE